MGTVTDKEMLESILGHPSSIGSFAGMIANQKLTYPDKSIDELIDLSLQVRRRIHERLEESKTDESSNSDRAIGKNIKL